MDGGTINFYKYCKLIYLKTQVTLYNMNKPLSSDLVQIHKIEVLTLGPTTRYLLGIIMKFKEKENELQIYFNKNQTPLAIKILIIELEDQALDIKDIFLNNESIFKTNNNEKLNIIEIFETKTVEDNTLRILFLNTESYYYELGCMILPDTPNKPATYYMNKE